MSTDSHSGSNALTLMTPGFRDWWFLVELHTNFDASRVVTGGSWFRNAEISAFVADGRTTRELGADLGATIANEPMNARPVGLSRDGRYVLYSSNRGSSVIRVWREDLQTGTRLQLTIPGQQFVFAVSGALSGDGATFVLLGSDLSSLHRGTVGGDVTSIGRTDPVFNQRYRLSLSHDGSVVTWTQNQQSLPQLMRWTAATGAAVVSADPSRNPDGGVDGGFVAADGATVYFSTRARNIAGGDASLKVIARTDLVGPGPGPLPSGAHRPPTRLGLPCGSSTRGSASARRLGYPTPGPP
jgi:hypothetical protein